LDWVRKELCPNADKPEITVAVVSPTAQVDTAGKYHIDGLFYVAPEEILMLAADTIEKLRNLRLKYGAKEYSECVNDFASDLKINGMDLDSIRKRVLKKPL